MVFGVVPSHHLHLKEIPCSIKLMSATPYSTVVSIVVFPSALSSIAVGDGWSAFTAGSGERVST